MKLDLSMHYELLPLEKCVGRGGGVSFIIWNPKSKRLSEINGVRNVQMLYITHPSAHISTYLKCKLF
jgi:hypothetical protein